MKKVIYAIMFSVLMPLCGCAQKSQKSQTTEPKSYEIKNLPTITPAKTFAENPKMMFDVIKNEFAGKVILIDFWATWCGPCMNAMKSIDPIKESYLAKKEPVAFVYITGETSPEKTWNIVIPKIKGFHYRLTDAQYNSLLDWLGIKGIPTYMVIGKDGKVTYNNIQSGGYPGDEVIVTEINKALKPSAK